MKSSKSKPPVKAVCIETIRQNKSELRSSTLWQWLSFTIPILVVAPIFLPFNICAEVIFKSVTIPAQIDFVHSDGQSGQRLFNEFIGSGAALFDYDNDGDLDLYLINGAPQSPFGSETALKPNRMYQNQGDNTFTDVTQITNLGHTGYEPVALTN